MRCGRGVNFVIKNTGDYPATNITCSVEVKGGIMSELNRNWTKNITRLEPNTQERFSTGFFFGFGYITITARMNCSEHIPIAPIDAEGTQMFFLTFAFQ
jgi:hypothetical protein